ncbi:hypothetical protein [Gluconobacter wancherniae]|uniref:hypothetical protein n=1 Tax=Gluconobacter wancherniae TaxID=1307955 RepID=UPI001B8BAD87|nr:hypothetical protein [Gluconobacter wancherniae]MBS1095295.1 hypothetical protein [Gluconobacter wancherniae]
MEDSEIGLSRRMREEISQILKDGNLSLRCHEVIDLQSFNDALNNLTEIIKSGENPIVHLDMHGSEHNGLSICGTDISIPWKDLYKKLSEINKLTKNSLFIFSWACWGISVAEEIDILKPCAYRTIIAPNKEVSAGFLEDQIPKFYKKLFEGRNVTDSFHLIKEQFSIGIAEMVALPIFARTLANLTNDKKYIEREVWNDTVSENIKKTSLWRKELRKLSKKLSDPKSIENINFINSHIKIFMHGIDSYLTFWRVYTEYKKLDLLKIKLERERYRSAGA